MSKTTLSTITSWLHSPDQCFPKSSILAGLKWKLLTNIARKNKKQHQLKLLIDDITFSQVIHGEDTTHVEALVEAECIVIFSLGTIVQFNGLKAEDVNKMMDAFGKHGRCHFIVRIDEKLALEARKLQDNRQHPNVHIVDYNLKIKQADMLGAVCWCAYDLHTFLRRSEIQCRHSGVFEGGLVWTNHKTFGDTFPAQIDQLLGQEELQDGQSGGKV
uniref:Uncharacterized protein n=1 Tax=Ditylenchus dipsaci TaxID=166011 RepID=A0A915D8Z6_9BILA